MFLGNESLTNWIADNLLQAKQINDCVLEIDEVGRFLLIKPKTITLVSGQNNIPEERENVIFNPDFEIEIDSIEDRFADVVDYLLFQFGDRWYYCSQLQPNEIQEFKYLGKFIGESVGDDFDWPYLGIHGGFDLCNGSREYTDWCTKAKFLGKTTLGICEDNTLAGTLSFQNACDKAGIKSIIGETITILTSDSDKYTIKLYCLNNEGWKALLYINAKINVENDGQGIGENEFLLLANDNLVCVLTPEVDLVIKYKMYSKAFKHLYYQLDFVEWSSQSRDEKWLLAIQGYFKNWMKQLPPVLICDSYYLDATDFEIRKSLNNIGRVGFKNQSKDQYFKTFTDVATQVLSLCKGSGEDDDKYLSVLATAASNTKAFCDIASFKVVTEFRLPEYELTVEEGLQFKDKEELFYYLIEKGFEEKVIAKGLDEAVYGDRLEKEVEVILKGGFISYFLILADIVNWCASQNIFVGIGRGSAAGCLISYLLGIVKLDPLQYGLLFERFLNEGRIGKSLPDIDTDFQGSRRDEVKRYIESRYGKDYVTSIGTYGTFKMKAALKDLARERGVDYQKTNYITAIISPESSFTELFIAAAQITPLKEYVQKNHKVIEKLPLCLNQPRNASIHAAGVVIVPKENGPIYEQMPVKTIDGVLVSEWEGTFIDQAGYLKCDILGIKQLDKFADIVNLIKETTGKIVTFDDIDDDINNQGVYEYFRNGFNEDVFQFGAAGLKAYCKELKPDGIEDLIATVALYRPGPIETGVHKKYIKVKNGLEFVEYDKGTETVTEITYGQIIYQEQIMQVFTHVAGFTLVQADDVRKAISKTTVSRAERLKSLQGYQEKFEKQGMANGYKKEDLDILWEKIEKFATYSFNKSHAACYAVTGYYCQWFKYKYPLQFWTVSLQYSSDDEIINRISEIKKTSSIEIASVDINKSGLKFETDTKAQTIYWSINSVKWVGEKAVMQILEERKVNGQFFSIEDFCSRVAGRAVNKRCITNLILAGAFDSIEKIRPADRYTVLQKYYNFIEQDLPEDYKDAAQWKEYQWILKQKALTGFGYIDYAKIIAASSFASKSHKFKENAEVLFSSEEEDGADVIVCGIIVNVIERNSKKGKFAQVELQDNTDILYITLWNETYEPLKKDLNNAINKIAIMTGNIKNDSYKNTKVIHSNRYTKIEII